jgi:hypothetical protein
VSRGRRIGNACARRVRPTAAVSSMRLGNAVDQTETRNIYNSSIRPSSSVLVAGLAGYTSLADLDLFEAEKP